METQELIQDLHYARYALGEAHSNINLIPDETVENMCEGDEELFEECRLKLTHAIEHVRKQEKKMNTLVKLEEHHWVWEKMPRTLVQYMQMGVSNGKDLKKLMNLRCEIPEWLEKECDLMEAHIPAGGWVILIMKALNHEYETKVNDHADT